MWVIIGMVESLKSHFNASDSNCFGQFTPECVIDDQILHKFYTKL